VCWLIAIGAGLDPLFPQLLLFLSLFNLLAGNGAFVFLSMIAPIRRGWLYLIPFSLTVFAYWVLISIAAYRALWQLLARPFHWEKTEHGISRQPDAMQTRSAS
jgi:glycosyltransferase XagB